MKKKSATKELMYANGIDVSSGKPGVPAITQKEFAKKIDQNLEQLSQEPLPDGDQLEKLQQQKSNRHFGVVESIDPDDLEQTGWGIIFANGNTRKEQQRTQAIRGRLQALIDQRNIDTNNKVRIFTGADGYQPNSSYTDFMMHHGVSPVDPADPEKLPYYLLLVGSPAEIPFEFQYKLDITFAVGRIDFDELDEFENYARSVINAEQGLSQPAQTAEFFAVTHPKDPATELSLNNLIQPLYNTFNEQKDLETFPANWEGSPRFSRGSTSKKELLKILNTPPALLFTASHGIEYLKNTADKQQKQRKDQGALLCSDWPGFEKMDPENPVSPDQYLAARDLDGMADLRGLISFNFACYSAGTAANYQFDEAFLTGRPETMPALRQGDKIADNSFVASLPKKMLSLGAQAYIGHIGRAWPSSFLWRNVVTIDAYKSLMIKLLQGKTVGAAMEKAGQRHQALARYYLNRMDELGINTPVDRMPDLAYAYTAYKDARSYTVIGDPAVRLATGNAKIKQPALPVKTEIPQKITTDTSIDSIDKNLSEPASVTPSIQDIKEQKPDTTTENNPELKLTLTSLSGGAEKTLLETTIHDSGDIQTHVDENLQDDSKALLKLHKFLIKTAIKLKKHQN